MAPQRDIEGIIRGILAELGLGMRDLNFYTPRQWADRGELYCRNALLIVVYDGCDAGRAFSYDREDYKTHEAFHERLREHGMYTEQGTVWYSGVYPTGPRR